MQNQNLRGFEFDFNKLYRELKQEKRSKFLPRSGYYYLTWNDFFHSVIEQTIKYFRKNNETSVSEHRFRAIYWTTLKFERLRSYNHKKSNSEYKNFVSRDERYVDERDFHNPIDLDLKLMRDEVSRNYPSLELILGGHSYKTGADVVGIGERGFAQRCYKETKRLKQNGYIK